MQLDKEEVMQPVEPALITIGELEIRYLMDGTVNGAGSGMFELTVPPGAHVPPPHSHADNEEIIYCLEGTLRCSVDGEVRDLKPGEQSYTPRGAVHGFSNPHDRTARVLVVLTPDIGAQYFRDVADVAGAPGGPNPARMAQVMARYGLVPSPPRHAGNAG
jgi:quercetin dioxygenase-like cupin family protein